MADVELSHSSGTSDQAVSRAVPPKPKAWAQKAKALAEQERGTSDGRSMAYIAWFLAVTVLGLIALGCVPCSCSFPARLLVISRQQNE